MADLGDLRRRLEALEAHLRALRAVLILLTIGVMVESAVFILQSWG